MSGLEPFEITLENNILLPIQMQSIATKYKVKFIIFIFDNSPG